MKTIMTEHDLLNYLREVSQKSIVNTSLSLFESDSYVAKFANELDKEMKNLTEQEEAAEEEEPAEEDAEAAENEEDAESELPKPAKKPKINPAAEKAMALPGYEKDLAVTFDQILTAINLVRAGNSTKSKKTKGEIQDYFSKLDDEEKGVLAIYLKELAKIMTGAIEGDDAHDPSDASSFFDITVKQEKQKNNLPKVEKDAPQVATQKNTTQQSGEEDVTPPIKVNEKQDYSGLKVIRG